MYDYHISVARSLAHVCVCVCINDIIPIDLLPQRPCLGAAEPGAVSQSPGRRVRL